MQLYNDGSAAIHNTLWSNSSYSDGEGKVIGCPAVGTKVTVGSGRAVTNSVVAHTRGTRPISGWVTSEFIRLSTSSAQHSASSESRPRVPCSGCGAKRLGRDYSRNQLKRCRHEQ